MKLSLETVMNTTHRTALSTLLALAYVLPAAAQPAVDAARVVAPSLALQRTPEEVLRGELRGALVRAMESGAFAGTAPDQVALSLSLPAERFVDFGLVLDSRANGRDGVAVLGTTPGGIAQSLGVRAGDVIAAVNDRPLAALGEEPDGTARAVTVLRTTASELVEGGTLSLRVRRDGGEQTLSGPVRARWIPAVRLEVGEGTLVASNAPVAAVTRAASVAPAQAGGCGRISVFHIAPRSENLYAAKILSIDGEIPGPKNQETFRVSAGPHTLEVAEQIVYQDIPAVYSRARRHTTKELVVVVEPGTTYLIASRLNEENRYGFGDRSYWSPVVWKEISENCN